MALAESRLPIRDPKKGSIPIWPSNAIQPSESRSPGQTLGAGCGLCLGAVEEGNDQGPT